MKLILPSSTVPALAATATITYLTCFATSSFAQKFDCVAPNDCVNRPSFQIRTIVHGTTSDPFWQQMQGGFVTAAQSMNVNLTLTMYNVFDPTLMENDINAVASSQSKPDALVVTIPDSSVQAAIKNLIQTTSIPVFGLNSGADVAAQMGILGFVAQDEILAGQVAGQYFANRTTSKDKGLFVNPEASNVGLQQRLTGLQSILTNNTITVVNVNGTSSTDMYNELKNSLKGCNYSFIQLAGATPLQALLYAMEANSCSFQKTLIGCVDVNDQVYAAIEQGLLTFTLSQQNNLQASMPIVMASLYATTGKLLAPSSAENGVYLSGPKLIDVDNLPSVEAQTCEAEGYPVCPNDMSVDGSPSTCPCTDRSKFVIAGVTHGVTTDPFWDEVYAAANQSGKDFGVDLQLTRLVPQSSSDSLYTSMVNQIDSFCSQANPLISGLFVTIPNDMVAQAVKTSCTDRNIPVIAISTGMNMSSDAGALLYIGQDDFHAGKLAGERLVRAGVTSGICLSHESNNSAFAERCAGMAEAFTNGSDLSYLGMVQVPSNNPSQYTSIVEKAVGETGSWSSVGALVLGLVQLPSILDVRSSHSGLVIGSFDTGDTLYSALSSGEVLFGIDQNPYLQGYWPVPFLTWYLSTNQSLVNKVVDTGPQFVETAPTSAEQACESIFFAACPNATTAGQSSAYFPTISKVVIASAVMLLSSSELCG